MLSVRPRQDFDRFSRFVARLLSHIPRYGHVVQLRNEHRHHPQPRWRKVDVNDNMPRKLSTMLNLFTVSIICVATSVILSRVDGFWQRTLSVMGLNLILCGWASFSTAKAELLMLVLTYVLNPFLVLDALELFCIFCNAFNSLFLFLETLPCSLRCTTHRTDLVPHNRAAVIVERSTCCFS